MNSDGLMARLKAELGRNKAKSAVLAGMCLVAAYFWVPLVGKWLSNGSDTDVATVNSADALAVPAQVAAINEQSVTAEPVDWETAMSRLREEPLMTSIDSFSLTRNPFANLSIPDAIKSLQDEEEREEETESHLEIAADTTPPKFDELGLLLSGTMVGSRSRMATVNGKSYREGEEITTAVGNTANEETLGPRAAETTLVMQEIHSQFVIVSYGGERHTLRLQPITLSQSRRILMNRRSLKRVEN